MTTITAVVETLFQKTCAKIVILFDMTKYFCQKKRSITIIGKKTVKKANSQSRTMVVNIPLPVGSASVRGGSRNSPNTAEPLPDMAA